MEALARTTVRTRIPLMDLRREYHASRDELLAACERVLGRMQLIGGEEVRAFEAEMAAYLGVRHVRGVASGTDALWLAVAAAGVGPGDEVLVQANAFVAAVEALQRAGARPVPVDIRLEDLGPDPDDLAARLSPHTRGLLVVHLYELQAAMLRVKLHVLDARNRRRAEIAAYYTERLHELVVTPPECPSRTAVYHQYVVRTPRRDALRAYLAERDIETGIHYPVPV